jgi:hypothetical protein
MLHQPEKPSQIYPQNHIIFGQSLITPLQRCTNHKLIVTNELHQLEMTITRLREAIGDVERKPKLEEARGIEGEIVG